MTEKQNRDIDSKIVDKFEDVKNGVSGALKVVNDRQDKMESEQKGMKIEGPDGNDKGPT